MGDLGEVQKFRGCSTQVIVQRCGCLLGDAAGASQMHEVRRAGHAKKEVGLLDSKARLTKLQESSSSGLPSDDEGLDFRVMFVQLGLWAFGAPQYGNCLLRPMPKSKRSVLRQDIGREVIWGHLGSWGDAELSVIRTKANALARLRELLAGREEGRRSRNQESVILIAIDASLGIPNTSTGLRPLQDTLVSEREQQSNKRVPLVPPATSKDVKRACTWVKVLSDSACSKIMKDPRKDMRDSRLDSFQRWPCGRIH